VPDTCKLFSLRKIYGMSTLGTRGTVADRKVYYSRKWHRPLVFLFAYLSQQIRPSALLTLLILIPFSPGIRSVCCCPSRGLSAPWRRRAWVPFNRCGQDKLIPYTSLASGFDRCKTFQLVQGFYHGRESISVKVFNTQVRGHISESRE
jgi:hypothetical protein